MKHLPNLLTLGNLFSGCMAIVFILNSQPYLIEMADGSPYWVIGTEQAFWGSICIFVAAALDMLDGLAARSLKIFSPIGKDLDSLADLVSFGVAPSMILFKFLWAANIAQPNALDVSMWLMAPAFLVACFGALRLARFNVSKPLGASFQGLPIPGAGILIASFPLINWYNPTFGMMLKSPWVIYLIIGVVSWMMVSKIPFFKLLPYEWNAKTITPRVILIGSFIVLFALFNVAAIPMSFIIYILCSVLFKQPQLIK
jgi:CDP-diacylglycerol--serine O-phosphatidyltransferase